MEHTLALRFMPVQLSAHSLTFFDQISSLLLRAYFLRGLFCFLYIQSLCFERGSDSDSELFMWEELSHGSFPPRRGMLRLSHQHLSTFPLVVS